MSKNVVLICERKYKKLQCPLSLKYFFVQNCLYSEHTMILRFDEPRTGLCWLCSQGVYQASQYINPFTNFAKWPRMDKKNMSCHKKIQIMAKHFKGPLPFRFMYFYVLFIPIFSHVLRDGTFYLAHVRSLPCLVSQSINPSLTGLVEICWKCSIFSNLLQGLS